MQPDYIDLIEPTPKLHSKKCRLLAFVLRIFLQFGTFTAALLAWYLYDYFIALLTLVSSFIIMGIVRSKMRNDVIPSTQREYQYSDQSIADWYSAKRLCYEEPDTTLEA